MTLPSPLTREAVRAWLWDGHGCAVTPAGADAVLALVEAKVREALRPSDALRDGDYEAIVARIMGRKEGE